MTIDERLIVATEGSRELNCLVAQELGWKSEPGVEPPTEDGLLDITRPMGESHPPEYTTSIDAALTLVPEGATYRLCNNGMDIQGIRGPYQCQLRNTKKAPGYQSGQSKTLALAICIAALKARA